MRAALTEAGLFKVERTEDGLSAIDLLVASEVVTSKGAARRAIEEGGAYINNVKITDIEAKIPYVSLLNGKFLVIRRGKKTMAGIEVSD